MSDYIFNNIYVLIPVALFIAIRIIEARKKRQAKLEEQNKKQVSETEEDYDEPPAPSFIPAAAKKIPVHVPAVPLRLSMETETVKTKVREVPDKNAGPAKTQASAKPASCGFPQNLDYLPPLKRALVLSEILGPPRGE